MSLLPKYLNKIDLMGLCKISGLWDFHPNFSLFYLLSLVWLDTYHIGGSPWMILIQRLWDLNRLFLFVILYLFSTDTSKKSVSVSLLVRHRHLWLRSIYSFLKIITSGNMSVSVSFLHRLWSLLFWKYWHDHYWLICADMPVSAMYHLCIMENDLLTLPIWGWIISSLK